MANFNYDAAAQTASEIVAFFGAPATIIRAGLSISPATGQATGAAQQTLTGVATPIMPMTRERDGVRVTYRQCYWDGAQVETGDTLNGNVVARVKTIIDNSGRPIAQRLEFNEV